MKNRDKRKKSHKLYKKIKSHDNQQKPIKLCQEISHTSTSLNRDG
jgi:hypothetical protein